VEISRYINHSWVLFQLGLSNNNDFSALQNYFAELWGCPSDEVKISLYPNGYVASKPL
jgi:hypothetical protein